MSFKNLFSFGPVAELFLELDGAASRPTIRHPIDKALTLPLFHGDEPVTGILRVVVPAGRTLEHSGITLEMLGVIEMPNERPSSYDFTHLLVDVEPASSAGGRALQGETSYRFDFSAVDKPHESYAGRSVRLRYVLRATIARSYALSNVVLEQDVWVQRLGQAPEMNHTIKMEVGIEDCLHLEFEYNQAKYPLQGVVLGKVFFLLVRIKIKHMELAILRREIVGSGADKQSDSETIAKYEIMDGAPIKGESIPVRLYLSPYALTPTFRNVQNKFSVKYFLNLVLVDEEERRYFKQQEISLWRKTYG
ncbi:hypothetical protein P43SY_004550 [Pythium insidiosum]|uniref:Vacuolar protein sorting-associated protein 26 n=1 Tax=Pythium insidiosum TaxID=114742 RepID=A0AAD5LQZ5_PYTIN|nr:hypothetical protein P43SY_004550 [Pythium insidiosum]